jgi:hypothetical protein
MPEPRLLQTYVLGFFPLFLMIVSYKTHFAVAVIDPHLVVQQLRLLAVPACLIVFHMSCCLFVYMCALSSRTAVLRVRCAQLAE